MLQWHEMISFTIVLYDIMVECHDMTLNNSMIWYDVKMLWYYAYCHDMISLYNFMILYDIMVQCHDVIFGIMSWYDIMLQWQDMISCYNIIYMISW